MRSPAAACPVDARRSSSADRERVRRLLAVLDALTEPQVASKQIRYRHGRCDPGLAVYADREKTHQILINLMSNAVKFTKAGGEITIECEPDGDSVHFQVSDTGEGIPAEKLGSIFEPFVQVKTGLHVRARWRRTRARDQPRPRADDARRLDRDE